MVNPKLTYQTKRVPSYLKGLVDRRARADGHVQRLQALLATWQEEMDEALATRDACDVLLEPWLASDGGGIDPVNAWKGRYGARGTLVGAVRHFLQEAGTAGISTTDLAKCVVEMLMLEFVDAKHRRAWVKTGIKSPLVKMVKLGTVERWTQPTPASGRARPSVWRFVPQAEQSISELSALAAASGLGIASATSSEALA